MFRNLKIAAVIPCYNEADNIGKVVARVVATQLVDRVLVVDDGSTDASVLIARSQGAEVLELGKMTGVGAALRTGFDHVKSLVDVIVVLAGNNKDEPKEMASLLLPIAEGRAAFVQGSRYLPGGSAGGDMPRYRRWATRLHPRLFSWVTGKRVSESTNGFRAFHVRLLNDEKIRLNQRWLDEYELEPYLYFKALTLGYPCAEVPVTKTYPPHGQRYTKMRPVLGWWSILRPLVFLRLGLRS